MNKGKVVIGMTQFACDPDRQRNLMKAEEQIRALAAKGAKIVCTQELFNGQYFAQIIDYTKYDWAEPVDGPTNQHMQKLAKELGISQGTVSHHLNILVRDDLICITKDGSRLRCSLNREALENMMDDIRRLLL